MSNKATVFIFHASDAVKDAAIEVCIASGEEDVFLDVETVEDRFRVLQKETQEVKELKEIIQRAKEEDAEYIHLF